MTWGLVLLLMAVFVTLQACMPFGFMPLDFLLLYVAFIGLQRGRGSGTAVGLLGGLVMDLLSGPPKLGLFTCAMGLTGLAADSLHRSANRESRRAQILYVMGLSLLHDSVLALGGRMLDLAQGGVRQVVLMYMLPKLITHAVLAVPFFWLLQYIIRRPVIRNKLANAPKIIRSLPR
jgi:rod shape-determining protein MreD